MIYTFPGFSLEATLTLPFIDKLIDQQQGMAKRRFIAWKKVITTNQSKSTIEKLESVNTFINQFEFKSDIEYTGAEDYWKTPIEFVVDGGGDCEDFAIAKYFTLLLMQVPMDTLRITYVKTNRFNRAHMVLAYYPTTKSEPLILDNLNANILPASKRPDLIPIYSFNGEHLWLAKKSGDDNQGDSSQLSKWQAVIDRMEKKE